MYRKQFSRVKQVASRTWQSSRFDRNTQPLGEDSPDALSSEMVRELDAGHDDTSQIPVAAALSTKKGTRAATSSSQARAQNSRCHDGVIARYVADPVLLLQEIDILTDGTHRYTRDIEYQSVRRDIYNNTHGQWQRLMDARDEVLECSSSRLAISRRKHAKRQPKLLFAFNFELPDFPVDENSKKKDDIPRVTKTIPVYLLAPDLEEAWLNTSEGENVISAFVTNELMPIAKKQLSIAGRLIESDSKRKTRVSDFTLKIYQDQLQNDLTKFFKAFIKYSTIKRECEQLFQEVLIGALSVDTLRSRLLTKLSDQEERSSDLLPSFVNHMLLDLGMKLNQVIDELKEAATDPSAVNNQVLLSLIDKLVQQEQELKVQAAEQDTKELRALSDQSCEDLRTMRKQFQGFYGFDDDVKTDDEASSTFSSSDPESSESEDDDDDWAHFGDDAEREPEFNWDAGFSELARSGPARKKSAFVTDDKEGQSSSDESDPFGELQEGNSAAYDGQLPDLDDDFWNFGSEDRVQKPKKQQQNTRKSIETDDSAAATTASVPTASAPNQLGFFDDVGQNTRNAPPSAGFPPGIQGYPPVGMPPWVMPQPWMFGHMPQQAMLGTTTPAPLAEGGRGGVSPEQLQQYHQRWLQQYQYMMQFGPHAAGMPPGMPTPGFNNTPGGPAGTR